MSLERYLCVGGVEVANPCRTAAYLKRLGNPCLPHPPDGSCCCCPDWLPRPCEATIRVGVDVSDPEQVCAGIFALEGIDVGWVIIDAYPVYPCPDERPATIPDADDPAWQPFAAPGEFFPIPASSCSPYGSGSGDLSQCGWQRYTFVDSTTGHAVSFVIWQNVTDAAPGDPGTTAVSFDNGATWHEGMTEHTWPVPCTAAGYSLTGLALTFEDTICFGFLAFNGGIGPYEVSIQYALAPAPIDVGTVPAPDSPAWLELVPPVVVPTIPPSGACWFWDGSAFGPDLPPDGFFRNTIRDLGTGQTIRVVSALNYSLWTPGNLAGSAWSFDQGETWQPITSGTFPVGPQAEDPLVFETPALDDAPWYDPAVPESADVLGVWLEEVRLGVPWSRNATPAMRGASLGPGRFGGRELQLAGWVYTRSAAATAYARNWLFEVLAGAGCEDGCDLPDAQVALYCDPERPDSGARTLKRVGLTAFDPGIEPEFPRACGLKFEATLTAEVPDLFLEPDRVADVELEIDPETTVCTICSPCPEPVPAPCACGGLGEPVRVVPQPDPAAVYCLPPEVSRFCSQVPAPHFWRDATAIIRVEAGTWPDDLARPGLANLRLRGWPNPAALTDPALFDCQEPCLDVEVGCIPPGSVLTIDGTTRSALLECGREELNGYAYLSSAGGRRFSWPDVSCYGLFVCVEADPANTAPGARLTIDFVLRERG